VPATLNLLGTAKNWHKFYFLVLYLSSLALSRTVFQNPQSCTCGGARAKKFCQGLKTAPVAFGDTSAREGLTRADFFARIRVMDILILIAITFAAGVVGGLVLADAFDLEKM